MRHRSRAGYPSHLFPLPQLLRLRLSHHRVYGIQDSEKCSGWITVTVIGIRVDPAPGRA